MPIYDFICHGCSHLIENAHMTFDEFDDMKSLGGLPCPKCPDWMHVKPGRFAIKFGKVPGKGSQTFPGSKRERRQLMEQRYEKRNARLEALPPQQKEKMVRFMERFGVKKTAPAGPEFA